LVLAAQYGSSIVRKGETDTSCFVRREDRATLY
jgi:hypothetical protein